MRFLRQVSFRATKRIKDDSEQAGDGVSAQTWSWRCRLGTGLEGGAVGGPEGDAQMIREPPGAFLAAPGSPGRDSEGSLGGALLQTRTGDPQRPTELPDRAGGASKAEGDSCLFQTQMLQF